MRFSSISISGQDSLHNGRGRTTWYEWKRYDLSVPTLHFTLANDVVVPVGTFNKHVGMNLKNRLQRSVLIERADKIHDFQTVNQLGPFVLRDYWTLRTFYTRDGGVTVYTDD